MLPGMNPGRTIRVMAFDQRVARTRLQLVTALAGLVAMEAVAVLVPNRLVPVHLMVMLVALAVSMTFFFLAYTRPSGGEIAFTLRGGSFATSSHRQRYFTLGFLF